MTAELEKAAKALGLTVLETDAETDASKNDDGSMASGDTVYSIRANTENGRLTVYANASLVYDLPDGSGLPVGYNFTYNDTSDAEARDVMAYLTEKYASLLNYDDPQIVLQGDYSFSGEYERRYLIYDAVADMTESILNYCFKTAQFAPDDRVDLMLVRVSDYLRTAEKLGDYPLISVEKTLPYYRFYVELQGADLLKMLQSSGLNIYGAYYVPAVRDEYISNLSTYTGDYN